MKTIFVSNLSAEVNKEQIRKLFIQFGEVHSVNLITHEETRKPTGICFIEMEPDDADVAIKALNGKDLQGQKIYVRLLKEGDGKDTMEL